MRRVLWSKEQGGKEIGPRTAHIECKVTDQTLGHIEVDRIIKGPAGAGDLHKARGSQVGQMMRQCVLFYPERPCDLCRSHALRCKTHQKPKDSHPAGMAECGKSVGGAILFHNSRLKEVKYTVQ